MMASSRPPPTVVIVDEGDGWPAALLEAVSAAGYALDRAEHLSAVLPLMQRPETVALIIQAGSVGFTGLITLRECRRLAPGAAVIVVTTGEIRPDLMRAFENGATSFVAWPASPEVIRRTLSHAAASTDSKLPPDPLADVRARARTQGGSSMANPQPPAGKPAPTTPAKAAPAPAPSAANPAVTAPSSAPQQKQAQPAATPGKAPGKK